MDQSYIKQPSPYKGVFSWDDAVLAVNIKHVDRDYDPTDPRTWPLVDLPSVYKDRPHHFPTSVPSFVAYERIEGYNNEELFLSPSKLTQHATVVNRALNWRFRHYPHTFSIDGSPRRRIGIPTAEFNTWMRFVHGPAWNKKTSTNTGGPIEMVRNNVSKTPFAKIKDALAEKNTATGVLEEKLRQAEEQYQSEFARAKNLQRAYDDQDQYIQKVVALNRRLRQDLDSADKHIKNLGEELRKQEIATCQARTEAKTAEEQIKEIWEMISGDQTQAKRNAERGDAGDQVKRLKTERGADK